MFAASSKFAVSVPPITLDSVGVGTVTSPPVVMFTSAVSSVEQPTSKVVAAKRLKINLFVFILIVLKN